MRLLIKTKIHNLPLNKWTNSRRIEQLGKELFLAGVLSALRIAETEH